MWPFQSLHCVKKKHPQTPSITLNYQLYALKKQSQKKITQQKPTTKKQKNQHTNPRVLPRPVSPQPSPPLAPVKSAYPKRWNESPLESVDPRLEAPWCSPTTGSPLLSAPWCQCLDLNHPGWTQLKWQMYTYWIRVVINISIYLVSEGIPQVYHVQLFSTCAFCEDVLDFLCTWKSGRK